MIGKGVIKRPWYGAGRWYVGSTYITSWVPALGLASNLDYPGDGALVGSAFSHIVINALKIERNHEIFSKGSPALSPQPGSFTSELRGFFCRKPAVRRSGRGFPVNKYPMTSPGFPGVLSNGRWSENGPESATA